MEEKQKYTTIRITLKFRDWLDKRAKNRRETYEEILKRLLSKLDKKNEDLK